MQVNGSDQNVELTQEAESQAVPNEPQPDPVLENGVKKFVNDGGLIHNMDPNEVKKITTYSLLKINFY